MKLAVYGLGKLGHPLLWVLAKSGFDVEGVDPSPVMPGTTEPGVNWEGMEVIGHDSPIPADVSFIVVPTPSLNKGDHRGGFDSAFVETALRQIRNVNKGAEGKPTAVIVSTLSPGTCDILAKQFEALDIVYNPTFIALGNVVEGLVRPDLLLIGGNSQIAKFRVTDIWGQVFKAFAFDPPFENKGRYLHQAGFTEVELIKLSVNAALGTKISLANSLGQLFKAWGVNPAAVKVVGQDPRIGTAYFTPGSPISGPCLPRDNAALQFAGIQKGVQLPLASATDRVNQDVLQRLLDRVLYLDPRSVGILGMSYKYGSDVDTDAPGPWLQDRLIKRDIEVFTHDVVLGGDLDVASTCDVTVVTQKEYAWVCPAHDVIELWP